MTSTLRLMAHNPGWRQEFEQSRSSLLQATEGWIAEIRHVGGTSFKDGVARPSIDMLAGITDLPALNDVCSLVEGLNYRRQITPAWCSDELCALLTKPRSGDESHAVLIVRHEAALWQRVVAMQTWLAERLQDRQQLENIKKDNFATGCSALENYQRAKDAFFATIEFKI